MAAGKATYKRALINAAAGGDREIVAAVANHRIAVHGLYLSGTGTAETLVRFESAAGGTALTGEMTLGVGAVSSTQLTLPFSEVPWIITDAHVVSTDDNLSLEIGAGDDMDGVIIYSLIKVR